MFQLGHFFFTPRQESSDNFHLQLAGLNFSTRNHFISNCQLFWNSAEALLMISLEDLCRISFSTWSVWHSHSFLLSFFTRDGLFRCPSSRFLHRFSETSRACLTTSQDTFFRFTSSTCSSSCNSVSYTAHGSTCPRLSSGGSRGVSCSSKCRPSSYWLWIVSFTVLRADTSISVPLHVLPYRKSMQYLVMYFYYTVLELNILETGTTRPSHYFLFLPFP